MKPLSWATGVVLLAVAGEAGAEEHVVKMAGKDYAPAVLDAKVGDTIRFVNEDADWHNVFALDGCLRAGSRQAGARGGDDFDPDTAGHVRDRVRPSPADAADRGGCTMRVVAMRKGAMRTIISVAAVITAGVLTSPAAAGPERIAWPANFASDYILYLQVDRHDRNRVRFMYVNPEADTQARGGEPLPDGTVLIMADRNAEIDGDGKPVIGPDGRFVATGDFTNVFVMEKGAGWGEGQPADMHNGDWDYAWFQPDGTHKPDAKHDGCFSCHANREERDFTFTYAKFLIDQGR